MIQLYQGLGDYSVVMGNNGSTPMWISEDGDYGLTPISIFDVHNWTASNFEELDECPASDRIRLAQIISDEVEAAHEVRLQKFLTETRDKASELGVRMFRLTSEGMDELV